MKQIDTTLLHDIQSAKPKKTTDWNNIRKNSEFYADISFPTNLRKCLQLKKRYSTIDIILLVIYPTSSIKARCSWQFEYLQRSIISQEQLRSNNAGGQEQTFRMK